MRPFRFLAAVQVEMDGTAFATHARRTAETGCSARLAKVRALRERLGISTFVSGDVDDPAPLVERPAGAWRGPA